MSGSINEVTILGHLGRDPEVRFFRGGGKVVTLRVATSECWKDRAGEWQEAKDWHTVAVYAEALCDEAEALLRKGARVWVRGKLSTRKWQDQSGQDRYTTEVVVRPGLGRLVASHERSGTFRASGEPGADDRGGSAPGPADDFDDIPY